MRFAPAVFLALTLTVPAAAASDTATPMTAAEFDAYVTGKTITYDYGGGVLGIEQYLANRQVRWAFEGDICLDGIWFQQADQICFVYEDDGVPQCWHFYREAGGLTATFLGDDLGIVISEIGQSTEPLACAGPDVGV